MLTRQGWTAVWGAMALFATGRILGIGEFYIFGAAVMLLVLFAVSYVHLVRLDLEIGRRVHPARVHAGHTSRVEIHVRNRRRYPSPLLRLHDQVSGTKGAEMLLPPLETRGQASTSYRLPTAHRGVVRIGPLRVIVTDPFGLAQSTVDATEPVEVTVFPRVDEVRPVPFTVGHDPLAGTRQAHTLSNSGDDFYALRPYVMGDDLRRIHWPSTARHDELLVRQHEQPWQGRTTVLLDVNQAAYTPQSLEVAISAAASVASANSKRGDLVRLITTDGRDSGFGMGNAHLDTMLEQLALVEADTSARLGSVVEVLRRDKASGGALITVVGDLSSDRTTGLAHLGRRMGLFAVVQVEPFDAGPRQPTPMGRLDQLSVIRVTGEVPFALAWNHVMGSQPRNRFVSKVGV